MQTLIKLQVFLLCIINLQSKILNKQKPTTASHLQSVTLEDLTIEHLFKGKRSKMHELNAHI